MAAIDSFFHLSTLGDFERPLATETRCDLCDRIIKVSESCIRFPSCTNPSQHVFHQQCVTKYRYLYRNTLHDNPDLCPKCDQDGKCTQEDAGLIFETSSKKRNLSRMTEICLFYGPPSRQLQQITRSRFPYQPEVLYWAFIGRPQLNTALLSRQDQRDIQAALDLHIAEESANH